MDEKIEAKEFYDCPHVHCPQQLVQCPRIEMIVHVPPLSTQKKWLSICSYQNLSGSFQISNHQYTYMLLIISFLHWVTAGEKRVIGGGGEVGQGKATLCREEVFIKQLNQYN